MDGAEGEGRVGAEVVVEVAAFAEVRNDVAVIDAKVDVEA